MGLNRSSLVFIIYGGQFLGLAIMFSFFFKALEEQPKEKEHRTPKA